VLVYGIKFNSSALVNIFSLHGKLMGASVGFTAIMFIFSAWGWLVLKKSKKRWTAIVYAVMLFLSTVIFVGIAIAVPIARGNY
jgi:hypothetical protein